MKLIFCVQILVALSVTSCKSRDFRAESEAKIINGTPVAADEEAALSTVLITNLDEGGAIRSICTGVIVGPGTIATAAHCFRPTDVGYRVHFRTELAKEASPERDDSRSISFSLSNVHIHPEYVRDGKSRRNDVALVALDQNVPSPYKPVAIAPDSIDLRQEFLALGYGRVGPNATHFDLLNYTLRKVPAYVKDVDPALALLEMTYKNDQGTCSGDSGGPLFLETQKGLSLVGLNSRGDCETYNYVTDVRPYARSAFFLDVVQSNRPLSQTGNTKPRSTRPTQGALAWLPTPKSVECTSTDNAELKLKITFQGAGTNFPTRFATGEKTEGTAFLVFQESLVSSQQGAQVVSITGAGDGLTTIALVVAGRGEVELSSTGTKAEGVYLSKQSSKKLTLACAVNE